MPGKSIEISVGGVKKNYGMEELATTGNSGAIISPEDISEAVSDYLTANPPEVGNAISYEEQELTEVQQQQARTNINAQVAGDYLEEEDLQGAINTALAQAKASGEFDGPDEVSDDSIATNDEVTDLIDGIFGT